MAKIRVTRSDIAQATADISTNKERCSHCPIAQALTRRGYQDVNVSGTTARWKNGRTTVSKPLPTTAQTFVKQYDRGDKVGSIVFDLD